MTTLTDAAAAQASIDTGIHDQLMSAVKVLSRVFTLLALPLAMIMLASSLISGNMQLAKKSVVLLAIITFMYLFSSFLTATNTEAESALESVTAINSLYVIIPVLLIIVAIFIFAKYRSDYSDIDLSEFERENSSDTNQNNAYETVLDNIENIGSRNTDETVENNTADHSEAPLTKDKEENQKIVKNKRKVNIS